MLEKVMGDIEAEEVGRALPFEFAFDKDTG